MGIILAGSLGEGATLALDEKIDVIRACVDALAGKASVVPGWPHSTRGAVEPARAAEAAGSDGLMVSLPYAYATDWYEMKAHVSAVIAATKLPCMLYNNPLAYRADYLPEHVVELAEQHSNLAAVKESSADVRRVTELRRLLGDRIEVLVGVDDLIVEGIAAGATGWVAGLVNAFPHESVHLFDLARDGHHDSARELYEWFLPLLRLVTVPKLVQLIKLVQESVGHGRRSCVRRAWRGERQSCASRRRRSAKRSSAASGAARSRGARERRGIARPESGAMNLALRTGQQRPEPPVSRRRSRPW